MLSRVKEGMSEIRGNKSNTFMKERAKLSINRKLKLRKVLRSKKERPKTERSPSSISCKFHGGCSEDHYPIGSVHVIEGGHGGHGGYIDYGHHGVSYDSDHGIDYGYHGTGGLDHLGTDYGHIGGNHAYNSMDYGHHGEDYGQHGMDFGHHNMDYGHHNMDYGHHNMDYEHHDMDYGHHHDDHHLHIEPIHVAEEHHNHVVHHVEPVPVPVPVAVPVHAPANPAPAVANKAAADAVANKAPAGVAVSAINMNGGQSQGSQSNAAQTVNTGYPVYYLPPAAPLVGMPAPNLVKPAPPANGPNPYEILTSDTLKAAAGQQKNEASGVSSGENPPNGNPPKASDNKESEGNNNEKKPSNGEDKDDKKPAGVINSGGKHRPVNTEVDHSSHFSKRHENIGSRRQTKEASKRTVRSLASVLLPSNIKSRYGNLRILSISG